METCADIKRGVYRLSNTPFNRRLNFLFRVDGMQAKQNRPIDRALKRAEDKGYNQSAFAVLMDTDPQTITNWKRRGMPPEHHEKAAEVLDWTVDELLGRKQMSIAPKDWPFPQVDVRRIGRLTEGELLQLQGIILDKVAELELNGQIRNSLKNEANKNLRTILVSAKNKSR